MYCKWQRTDRIDQRQLPVPMGGALQRSMEERVVLVERLERPLSES